jgi:hypothetical protein
MTVRTQDLDMKSCLCGQVERSREKEEDRQLSIKVSVMQPILRFLQLLCENHNKQLQNLLRYCLVLCSFVEGTFRYGPFSVT